MADVSPSRARSEKQLGDVSSVLQALKDEVAFLQAEVERKGAGFYIPLAKQLSSNKDSVDALILALNGAQAGFEARNADAVPAAPGAGSGSTSEQDIAKAIRALQRTVNEARAAYQGASVASKRLVEDADKLDIVVKACQTEYIKLKLLNNNAKAYVNAKRLKWQRQADSFRYWAEFVHFETIGAIQREMEDLTSEQEEWEAKHEADLARAREEFDRMMGGQKRIKCMMLLKKMKNSRLQAVFATWDDMVQTIKWERMEAEKAALMAQLNARFGHLSAEEIERKLRQFLKRWVNRKMLGPWKTWKDIWKAWVQQRLDDELAAERARLEAELAAMQNNVAMKKLKMHFAKIAGQLKSMCFKALVVSCNQKKTMKMLEGEAGQRLKAFLASKLQGTLRKCYSAIIKNHRNIEAENMKNNDNAKKVALLLEKLARGIVHRCFSALCATKWRVPRSVLPRLLSTLVLAPWMRPIKPSSVCSWMPSVWARCPPSSSTGRTSPRTLPLSSCTRCSRRRRHSARRLRRSSLACKVIAPTATPLHPMRRLRWMRQTRSASKQRWLSEVFTKS
jgi:hypothetical protein